MPGDQITAFARQSLTAAGAEGDHHVY